MKSRFTGTVRATLAFTALVSITAGTARGQLQRPGVGPTNPNAQNQSLATAEQIRLMDEQHRLDESRQRTDPVAKFMQAIKPRKRRYRDFDQVVLRGQTPVTPEMLGLMAESPYAADIAYYLAKHPDQSAAIAQMPPAEAGDAIRRIAGVMNEEALAPK